MVRSSFRNRLRAFQHMRGEPPSASFISDLEFLENRDLDLSVRSGSMLAFNALLVTIGTHPRLEDCVTAAKDSNDAAAQHGCRPGG